MLTSQYLDLAAAKLRQGWCQGRTCSLDGEPTSLANANQWCLDGALFAVHLALPKSDGYKLYTTISALVDTAVRTQHGMPVVKFNDVPGQTQDIIASFVENLANKVRATEAPPAPEAPAA